MPVVYKKDKTMGCRTKDLLFFLIGSGFFWLSSEFGLTSEQFQDLPTLLETIFSSRRTKTVHSREQKLRENSSEKLNLFANVRLQGEMSREEPSRKSNRLGMASAIFIL